MHTRYEEMILMIQLMTVKCQQSDVRMPDMRHESLPHMRTSMSQASSLTVKDNVSYIMSHVAFGFVLMSFMLHLILL